MKEERLRRLKAEQQRRRSEKLSYENPYQWAFYNQVEYDHRPVEFEKRKALVQPYSDIARKVVNASAAQTGKTVWELITLFWFIRKYSPAKAGFYFPTDSGVKKLVQDRFDPFAKKLYSNIVKSKKTEEISNTELKQYGDSSIYFFWYGGQITTESTPLDLIVCDEIRKTSVSKLEEVQKRLLASEVGAYERYASTFGFPDDAIDYYFRLGNQYQFNTKCTHCPKDFVMWRHFQDGSIIGEKRVEGKIEFFYRCPYCGGEIFDTNEGHWDAENAEHGMGSSYQTHGMLSKSIMRNANTLWREFKETQNMKEFLNSNIGIPYLDATRQLVTKDVLDNCVDKAITWQQNGVQNYMGVDVQLEFIAVVIKRMLENGKTAFSWMGYLYGTDNAPFKELSNLMKVFDINICVLDGLSPRAAEVREFCKEWKGRAFFCTYHSDENPKLVLWHDKIQVKAEEKTIRDVQQLDKYHVSINKDAMLEFSLKRFVNRDNVIPHPALLTCKMKVRDIPYKEKLNITGKGFEEFVTAAFCAWVFYPHMQQYVKEEFEETLKVDTGGGQKQDMKTGNKKYRFVTKALDPHLCDSDLFCNVALSRRYFRLSE